MTVSPAAWDAGLWRTGVRMSENTAGCRTYIAIDLKSFYASVECADRRYDPLTTNLVVADSSRTDKTICLAVSPSLKAYGIPGRPRLFEVVQRVKDINNDRQRRIKGTFRASSFDARELEKDPHLRLSYIVAPPRMKLYEEVSTKIFSIYLKYVSAEDVHVYSIDECFIDVTSYLNTYAMTAHELAMTMIKDVLYNTGITATAGIGTNLYLAKVAMDIVAKHVPADKDGVRIAELDEQSYRELLWCHTPLTDFWRCGPGIARRMRAIGCYTMGDIARLSTVNEDVIYKALGVNAELLIDHAWGVEPTLISAIKAYRPQTNSLSSGQVLKEPYPFEKGRLIVKEMADLLALDLVKKGLVTKQVVLYINFDRQSIRTGESGGWVYSTTGEKYSAPVSFDYYGRPAPAHAQGTANLEDWTSSSKRITAAFTEIFDRVVDPKLLIRRVTVNAVNIMPEKDAEKEEVQPDLFASAEPERRETDDRERRVQEASLKLKAKFGKNAVLKGMNLEKGGTTIERNRQIGGHNAGD